MQFLCQTREKKLTPSDRHVCIHNSWWTKIIWNKDKECYYTNGLLKRLHDHNETDSEEENQNNKTVEPTVDQQIRQTPINPTLKNSPLVTTTSLLLETLTAMTAMETTTATTATTTSAFGTVLTPQQRIASTIQKAFQHKGKKPGPPDSGGSGPPSGGGSGPPGGGGTGPPGGGQPA